MGRTKNMLTATQQDPVLLAKLATQINQIGVRLLANFGLISHETIVNYLAKKSVSPTTEGLILDSIRKYQHAKAQADEVSKEQVRAVLEMA